MKKIALAAILSCQVSMAYADGQKPKQVIRSIEITAPEMVIRAQGDDRFSLPENSTAELKKLKGDLTNAGVKFSNRQNEIGTIVHNMSFETRNANLQKLLEASASYDAELAAVEEAEAVFIDERERFIDQSVLSKLPEAEVAAVSEGAGQ